MSSIEVLLGPPGTGKTYTLLSRIEELLSSGVQPEEIAFVSFTKAATVQATERACEKFNMDRAQFPWFRTIHSMAFAGMGARVDVMKAKDWESFGDSCNYQFRDTESAAEGTLNFSQDGDALVSIDAMARASRSSVGTAILRCGDVPSHITEPMVGSFRRRLHDWKSQNNKIDFTDMLERALLADWKPPVRFAFVDEAQDCNALQNALARKWFVDNPRCEMVTFAGDDDQQIFGWSGAEYGALATLSRSCNTTILKQSYRVPRLAHGLAQKIIRQNRSRVAKEYLPREHEGRLLLARSMSDAIGMLEKPEDDEHEYAFALVRSVKEAHKIREACMSSGVPFVSEVGAQSPLQRTASGAAFGAIRSWRRGGNATASEYRYLLDCIPSAMRQDDGGSVALLPRGAKVAAAKNTDAVPLWRARDEFRLPATILDSFLSDKPCAMLQRNLDGDERVFMEHMILRPTPVPPIVITTQHRSKGREAHNVVICPNMAWPFARRRDRSVQGFEEENCVAYVAATRTLSTLVLLEPTTKQYYDYRGLLR